MSGPATNCRNRKQTVLMAARMRCNTTHETTKTEKERKKRDKRRGEMKHPLVPTCVCLCVWPAPLYSGSGSSVTERSTAVSSTFCVRHATDTQLHFYTVLIADHQSLQHSTVSDSPKWDGWRRPNRTSLSQLKKLPPKIGAYLCVGTAIHRVLTGPE